MARRWSWTMRGWRGAAAGLAMAMAALAAMGATAQDQFSGGALLDALRAGGLTLVMRHAQSPRTPPDAATANADNTTRERQLDDVGRDGARTLGESLKRLGVPIGAVRSSPAYRAMETAKLAGLTNVLPAAELTDGGQSMAATATDDRAAWLRARVARAPAPGTNAVLITHVQNMRGAFGDLASDVAEGEALIFRPDGRGGATLLARVPIEHWPRLGEP